MEDGDSAARYCADFRDVLRERDVSFRRAEELSGWGKSTIAAATRGPGLPNADLVGDVLGAIGLAPEDVARWRERHVRLREVATAPPVPDPARDPSVPRRSSRRRAEIAVFAALVVLVVALAAALVVVLAARPAPPARTVVVQNRVAIGDGMLVEDRTPSYLATRPVAHCANMPDCKIAGTEVWSGATFVAVCQLTGEVITNADLTSTNIGRNPNAAVSEVWLGARAPDGRVGYISEVYLAPAYRGGLGLPAC
ncbi:hypothetical protein Acsp06_03170 [Actinomycetospora sp. NBRC 106375]|uniref:hypothetical protein n=1 Tax=Actinomycetospora sp. NBRC 106375 TaxID=3032207 RepID=UPI0024A2955C|nr:hypothetical protein [Actinomycetospora sp. NBRC 106375]GLZ44132.1 hypothetical protein Acsp06_03170 [Actinomycetospora sp. NBRC 106375]